jgi:hypothetical protein
MTTGVDEIPLARPVIGEREEQAVLEVLRSGQLSLGPRLPAFEDAFAERVGARHACAVSSGTAGLHLALRAVGVEDGDEVVTTPFSFVATANAVVYERARPVFADIDPVTLNLDPDAAAAAITVLAGAQTEAPAFSPVIRGKLLTGSDPVFMRAHPVGSVSFESEVFDEPPWPADEKVMAEELGPYLATLEGARATR